MEAIRAQIERMGTASNPLLRIAYRGIKAVGALRRFLLSPRIRSQVLTRFRYREQHFQGEAYSQEDRYPELFTECRARLAGLAVPRILSFGCATGEEVFTLARYLPQAEIVGVDINRWCLKQCDARNRNGKLRFIHRLSAEFDELKGFDAIFCMAVFQRTEHRTAGVQPDRTGFTFDRFEAELGVLDRMLNEGGLLFLDQTDFDFEQTGLATGYKPLDFQGNRVVRDRPLFGKDNRLMSKEHCCARGFVKVAGR